MFEKKIERGFAYCVPSDQRLALPPNKGGTQMGQFFQIICPSRSPLSADPIYIFCYVSEWKKKRTRLFPTTNYCVTSDQRLTLPHGREHDERSFCRTQYCLIVGLSLASSVDNTSFLYTALRESVDKRRRVSFTASFASTVRRIF